MFAAEPDMVKVDESVVAAALRVVPSKVRLAESVNWLPVVKYGTRPEVSAVTRKLVEVAAPETVRPPVAVPSPIVELAVE